jgi:hypothetical protein
MTTSWKILAVSSLTTLTVISGTLGAVPSFAQVGRADSTATATAINATPASVTGTPSPTSELTGTPSPASERTGTPSAVLTGVKKTATATPTRTGPGATATALPRQKSGLPVAIVLEAGLRRIAVGLDARNALLMANSLVPRLFVIAPHYVPTGFVLQLIHVDPAQDQQTPPFASLQYVPKNLAKAKGAYSSFYVNIQYGLSSVIMPGTKPTVVVINPGKKGIGIVKGTLVDLKPKHGDEIVHVLFTRMAISYDVSSNVSKSKLRVSDLTKVASSLS